MINRANAVNDHTHRFNGAQRESSFSLEAVFTPGEEVNTELITIADIVHKTHVLFRCCTGFVTVIKSNVVKVYNVFSLIPGALLP